jgi:endonuclease/exonuclease/phosphatase family metal-dependent hydrolase
MRLRVATLNVWALPEPLAPKVAARIRAIGNRLGSLALDVAAFQEVWTADARRQLEAAGREAGLVHAWHSKPSYGGGLLVLSRLPIRSARFDAFSLRGDPGRPDHPDYYGGKGWATVEIETDAGPVTIVDTHLHARYARDVSHEYRAQRVGQIVELGFASRELRSPLVTVGDFNLTDRDPEHGILVGLTGLRDVARELADPRPTVLRANPYRSESSKPDRRVDYVLVRDGESARVVARSTQRIFDEAFEIDGRAASASNHAGVLSELEIVSGGGQAMPPPDPRAIVLATQMLEEGRREVGRRRTGDRVWAGVGVGAAALASFSVRDPRISRRKLLRTALQAGALIALTPGVGFSIVSEVLTPDELRAFDELSLRLTLLRAAPPGLATT